MLVMSTYCYLYLIIKEGVFLPVRFFLPLSFNRNYIPLPPPSEKMVCSPNLNWPDSSSDSCPPSSLASKRRHRRMGFGSRVLRCRRLPARSPSAAHLELSTVDRPHAPSSPPPAALMPRALHRRPPLSLRSPRRPHLAGCALPPCTGVRGRAEFPFLSSGLSPFRPRFESMT